MRFFTQHSRIDLYMAAQPEPPPTRPSRYQAGMSITAWSQLRV